ncbi:hypothetical protein ACRRTK_012747 [Alexandromys fortis]
MFGPDGVSSKGQPIPPRKPQATQGYMRRSGAGILSKKLSMETQPCPPCRWIFSGKGGLRCPQEHEQPVITRLGYHLHRAGEKGEGRTCVSQPAPVLGVALPATEWCKHLDNRKTNSLSSPYTRGRAA